MCQNVLLYDPGVHLLVVLRLHEAVECCSADANMRCVDGLQRTVHTTWFLLPDMWRFLLPDVEVGVGVLVGVLGNVRRVRP